MVCHYQTVDEGRAYFVEKTFYIFYFNKDNYVYFVNFLSTATDEASVSCFKKLFYYLNFTKITTNYILHKATIYRLERALWGRELGARFFKAH